MAGVYPVEGQLSLQSSSIQNYSKVKIICRNMRSRGAVRSVVCILLLNCGSVAPFSSGPPDPWPMTKSRRSTGQSLVTMHDSSDPLGQPSTPEKTLRKKANLKPFGRFLEIECWKRAELRGLEPVLQSIAEACKQINRIVQRAQTDDIYGVAVDIDGKPLEENVQGEVQQKLDVLCNTFMLRALCGSSRNIHSVASEEEDEPRSCAVVMGDSAFEVGEFIAVFDPIDGSKNIDASLPVGTIFGIYKTPPGSSINAKSFLQNGDNLVAAGYCLYSATTVLVLSMGAGVDGFTLDPDSGKFLHTMRDIRIPAAGSIYSFNEAYFNDFEEPVRRYLTALKQGSSATGLKSNARYIGALVADVHNVLINGGIYGYPSTRSNPKGKLRLLYESAPMSFIIEQAGGAGSTGRRRILDVVPDETHARVPTFLGSIENVFELDQFYKYYTDDDKTE